MRQKLSWRNLLLVGFTLFSMFFGAGNLIFPPFLGAEAGTLTWHAMRGFLLSAVGLPVLGVAAVAMAGGLDRLGRRVHPGFAFVFTLLIYCPSAPAWRFLERPALPSRWRCCRIWAALGRLLAAAPS